MAFFNNFRRQSINVCDVPLITRQTVHIEFEGYVKKKENPSNDEFRQNNSPTTNSEKIIWPPNPSTSNPNRFVNGLSTILRRTSFKIEKPVETTTALNPSDFILKSSTTKRQPKVFFTTSTNQIEATGKKFGPGPQNLVDGFIVSGNRNGEESGGKTQPFFERNFHVSNMYFHFYFFFGQKMMAEKRVPQLKRTIGQMKIATRPMAMMTMKAKMAETEMTAAVGIQVKNSSKSSEILGRQLCRQFWRSPNIKELLLPIHLFRESKLLV